MLKKYVFFSLMAMTMLLLVVAFIPNNQLEEDDFPERVKISLREVGNQLLLMEKDSSSLVLPIVALSQSTYELSFEKDLAILPNNLLAIIEASFNKSQLPNQYRVAVLQCTDGEVAYSYEINHSVAESMIPCMGRQLPKKCYTIKIHFMEKMVKESSEENNSLNKPSLLYLLLFVALVPVGFMMFKKQRTAPSINNKENPIELSIFKLYPQQHVLLQGNIEIKLSKKECELLIIFAEKPNQTIPRDELTKRVWEDHGVIVGRSLDTYISKLRKKLQADPNIELSNVHGIGYRLQVF